ncbi:helicase associated domain-containing protein [Clostridium estertheticum]|uniref:helicase associated domain-containing protein n=1 Tax=Clostridium estertheticum TaxID=238834 RepID=UPI001CF50775|nr:helicase associated domain-containing protein [Clostridium estertheticum]MCB2362198.1 helicase associated domain-containing protein [Clostridium estertheticum]
MIPDREKKLNKIGFIWDMNIKNWEMVFEKLLNYKNKYGTCNVSKVIDLKLSNWLKAQKNLYKEKKLELYRLNKLKQIGIKFKTHEDEWDYMYDKLKKYEMIFQDCFVKNNYDKKLYYWVIKQRKDYKKEKLIPYRSAKLQELNFTFDYNKNIFIKEYDKLREYKNKYGNCLVSNNYTDKSLAYWVCNIRKSYSKNILDEYKINLLNNIGFIWDVREYISNKRIEELKTFKKEKGTFDVPFRYRSLGKWLFDTKKLYRNGKLGLQIIDELRNLGLELD